jgi:enoyl-CoA hydratase
MSTDERRDNGLFAADLSMGRTTPLEPDTRVEGDSWLCRPQVLKRGGFASQCRQRPGARSRSLLRMRNVWVPERLGRYYLKANSKERKQMNEYKTILVARDGRVGTITLNRPEALNALNQELASEVLEAAQVLDRDPGIGAIILTGSERAFAAGADIKEMAHQSYMDMYQADFFADWDRLAKVRTPLIAAVAGYALGGGSELAMICDFIIAADNARFGQPEITLGLIPGMGGTQRLARAVGKARAMEMILTGRTMDAAEAERSGLVARVVPADRLADEARATAEVIASMSKPVAFLAKEAVNVAFEMSLAEGIHVERRLNHSCFAIADQKEGMQAFIEKRQADFAHR